MKKNEEDPKFKVWQCKIVVSKDARLPIAFDDSPWSAAIKAVESAGIPVLYCFSGWDGCLTPSERDIVVRERVLASTRVPNIVNVFDFKYAHGYTIAEKTLGLLVHIAETTGTLMRKQNLSTASKEEVVVHAPPALALVIVQHCAKQYGIDMPWTVNLDGTMPHDRIAITLKDMCANIHIIDFSA